MNGIIIILLEQIAITKFQYICPKGYGIKCKFCFGLQMNVCTS